MGVVNRGRLRRIWFYVHMWIGVGLTLVLIPLSVSGSYLVWRPEIERASHPARYAIAAQEARLAPSAYLSAAQAAFGERARVQTLRLPAQPGDPVTVTGVIGRPGGDRDERRAPQSDGGPQRSGDGARTGEAPRRPQQLTAWLDPGSAKVLDVANVREGFIMAVHNLHGQLLLPANGRQVVGWLGWFMLISCISGVWLWWPKAGPLMAGFRWRRGPGLLINLHYLTGFWVAIPLAVLSLSGALISFPPFTRAIVGAVAPVTPQRAGQGGPPGGGAMPLRRTELTADDAAARVLDAYPGTRLMTLTQPSRSRDALPAWRLQVKGGEGAPITIALDDAEAGAIKLTPQRVILAGDDTILLNRRIHDGIGMPLVWKWIITVAGLIPALLGVTGVIVWARSQLRKAAMRRRLAQPDAAPVPAE